MKILVTGGTGYIGSHTTVELMQKGHEVVIVDALFNSMIETVDAIEDITGKRPEFEQFDLTDNAKVDDFFSRHADIKGVIHFAAHKAVGESVQQPLMYYRNNLVSLMNIIEAMRKYDIPNIVFSSSCTVYGEPDADNLPISEKAPIKKAECPYGNTKQIAEEILEDSVNAYKTLNVIALRYFNPVGAHESARLGELPFGVPANLMPYITQTGYGIRKCLKVFGNDYDTPDGTPIRDYIHVMDLAKAHVAAVERMTDGKMKKQFAGGSSRILSMLLRALSFIFSAFSMITTFRESVVEVCAQKVIFLIWLTGMFERLTSFVKSAQPATIASRSLGFTALDTSSGLIRLSFSSICSNIG